MFHKIWTALATVVIVVEAVALVRHPDGRDTLCAWVRRVTGIRPERPWKKAVCVALGAFLVWFYVHIITGKV